jgi:transposase
MAPSTHKKYAPLSLKNKTIIQVLHQTSGMKVSEIIKHHKYKQLVKNVPKSTIYNIAKTPLTKNIVDKRIKNKAAGRKSLLSARDKRRFNLEVKKSQQSNLNFSSIDIQKACTLESQCSNQTLRRQFKSLGYYFLVNRRKGILTKADHKKRMQFARRIQKEYGKGEEQLEHWRNGISMFTDIVGFEFKRNPFEKARTPGARSWRKRGQGLECTRKGTKEGVKNVRLLIGIGYNKKVCLRVVAPHRMNGQQYADLINKKHFNKGLGPSRTIIQDNDPVQNSALACKAFKKQKIKLFPIPARSPDVNVIENLFHIAKKHLNKDALSNQLHVESEEEFLERIGAFLDNYPISKINKLVDSLPRRINQLITTKGKRLKY